VAAPLPVAVAVPVAVAAAEAEAEAEAAEGPVRWPLGVAAITEKNDDGMTCARNTSASSSVPTKCGDRLSDFIAAATESVGFVGVAGSDDDDDDDDSELVSLLLPSIDVASVRGAAEAEADDADNLTGADEADDDGVEKEEEEADADEAAWARNARIVSSRSRYLLTEPCDATRASAIFQKAVSSLPDAEADEDEEDEDDEEVGNLTL
jgi:hypothetical protein